MSAASSKKIEDFSTVSVFDWFTKPVDEKKLLSSLKEITQDSGELSILIVDDDNDLRSVIAKIFSCNGFKVAEASSGKKAVKMSKEMRPDLIILDVVMDDGDGFYVAETLRKDREFGQIPLIVYSARELTSQEKPRLALGNTVYVVKSKTNAQAFLQIAAKLLNGSLKRTLS